jgi:predicted enzyme related to lactoylglutathione lyase
MALTAHMVTVDCADERVAEARRQTGLGARVLAEESMPGFTWIVLADPEGNQFCVSAAE